MISVASEGVPFLDTQGHSGSFASKARAVTFRMQGKASDISAERYFRGRSVLKAVARFILRS